MSRVITAPGVLKNVQGQIDHVTDMYDDIKDNNLKPLTITLDAMSNASGAYSHTTEDERITEDMKAVTLEVGTPECFYAPVTVTTANGSAIVTCSDAHGNSTITVTFVKTSPVEGGVDYPPAVTSTEFDILADRIGSLSSLDTTTKTSTVSAINEVIGNIGTVPSGKTVEGQITEINSNIDTIGGWNSCSATTVTSRADIQNYLHGKAYYLPNNGSCSVCFYANFSGDEQVVNGNYYAGTLHKVDGNNYLVCILASLTGHGLIIGRTGTTWYYEKYI